MPTYLVAFVILDFDVSSTTNANNILFRVFARPEQILNTALGLEVGEKALELFERAFETRYELGKLDQVALPVFNRGGMENYGIVFYHEDYLLYEPSVSASSREKAFPFRTKPNQSLLFVIFHGMARRLPARMTNSW